MTESADARLAATNIQLRAEWPESLSSEAVPVNQALFTFDQEHRDAVYMMFGHIGPPVWMSKEEAIRRVSELDGTIAVKPRGAFVVSRSRAEDIWRALGKHLGLL